MAGFVIDGAAAAKKLRGRIKEEIDKAAFKPGLAVIILGDDPASTVYVRNKGRAAEEVGMASWTHKMPGDTSQNELLALIEKLNNDCSVDGILVQLPLPKHIETDIVIAAVDPKKDVDGFHPVNAGRLALGLPSLVPCTPQGCLMLLKDILPDLSGLRATVIGRSNIVGKPVAQLLLQAHCTVQVAHSRTADLKGECQRADIIVAAIGKPAFVRGDWIKPGAVVIDVGINRIDDESNPGKSRLIGDVHFQEVIQHAKAVTPVPGGVGPMTIACLLKNTLQAALHAR